MEFHSVYVPYAMNYVAQGISEEEAFKVQQGIFNIQRAVTWVIHHVAQEREFKERINKKVLERE